MPEVELKLLVDPRHHGRVRRAAALRKTRPRRRRLSTTYFDTPAGELAAAGVALRLRHDGERWIAGLKSRQLGAGGLHVREEWEHARGEPLLDLSLFAATPLARLEGSADLHARLIPVFGVTMERTTWTLSPRRGTRLEVALDDGFAEAGGRRERISEVEIECLSGDAEDAFGLAARLLQEVPLLPGVVSKAERGERLFRAGPATPAKVQAIALTGRERAGEVAKRVVEAALAALLRNAEGVLASDDPEFLHQARVALRRLRVAVRLFRRAIGTERARGWKAPLRRAATALGRARDWDVLATSTLPSVLEVERKKAPAGLRAGINRRRIRARAAARTALRSRAFAQALLDITRWLSEPRNNDGQRIGRFARRTLARRHERLVRLLRSAGTLDGAGRHRLRVAVKRLRYGTDALSGALPARKVRAYLEALSSLQDTLGAANDARVALSLLDGLPGAAGPPVRQRLLAASTPDATRLRAARRRIEDHAPF